MMIQGARLLDCGRAQWSFQTGDYPVDIDRVDIDKTVQVLRLVA